jgi:hypothetical protein
MTVSAEKKMLRHMALIKAGEDAAERLWKPASNVYADKVEDKITFYAAMIAATLDRHCVEGEESALIDKLVAKINWLIEEMRAEEAR